jgi:hypothetical protein
VLYVCVKITGTILHKEKDGLVPKVIIKRYTSDVKNASGAYKFLRTMYNYKAMVYDGNSAWIDQRKDLFKEALKGLKDIPSRSTREGVSHTNKSKSKSKYASKSSTMPTVQEGSEILSDYGYRISSYSSSVRNKCCLHLLNERLTCSYVD